MCPLSPAISHLNPYKNVLFDILAQISYLIAINSNWPPVIENKI